MGCNIMKRKSIKTLTAILLAVGIFDVLFIITMIIIFCIKDVVPDVLIQCVLGASGVEAFVSAAIQICKIIVKKERGNSDVQDYSEIDEP